MSNVSKISIQDLVPYKAQMCRIDNTNQNSVSHGSRMIKGSVRPWRFQKLLAFICTAEFLTLVLIKLIRIELRILSRSSPWFTLLWFPWSRLKDLLRHYFLMVCSWRHAYLGHAQIVPFDFRECQEILLSTPNHLFTITSHSYNEFPTFSNVSHIIRVSSWNLDTFPLIQIRSDPDNLSPGTWNGSG